ncbi:MarR family transcriptional regulator [Nicoliella spurrieriana]|uniref:HTH-type transcriptional regulator SarZ n=1 Tax=Nicoliella spurrieriana TaxID=2925830 RepID=A0A976RT48_9LACO|nr:MarR family transcriptional regulator [Nicoliella spurrieriana]UQS87393.1 MarR family transcriptional regulator [Nicoliella spurrieriana]
MNFSIDLDRQLCFQVSRTHQLYNKLYQKPLKKFNLTYVQYITLLTLWKKDGVTVNTLSKELDLTNGTLTPLLKRLEKGGWITRERDKEDERRLIVSLTPHGKELQGEITNCTEMCLNQMGYTPEEFNAALKNIQNIQERLNTAIEKQDD